MLHTEFLLQTAYDMLYKDLVKVFLLKKIVLLFWGKQGDTHLSVWLSLKNWHSWKAANHKANILRRLLILTLDLKNIHSLVELLEILLSHKLTTTHDIHTLRYNIVHVPLCRRSRLWEKLRHPLLGGLFLVGGYQVCLKVGPSLQESFFFFVADCTNAEVWEWLGIRWCVVLVHRLSKTDQNLNGWL